MATPRQCQGEHWCRVAVNKNTVAPMLCLRSTNHECMYHASKRCIRAVRWSTAGEVGTRCDKKMKPPMAHSGLHASTGRSAHGLSAAR
eukprot:6074683-Alexandrium_andersonii.AAC.1